MGDETQTPNADILTKHPLDFFVCSFVFKENLSILFGGHTRVQYS